MQKFAIEASLSPPTSEAPNTFSGAYRIRVPSMLSVSLRLSDPRLLALLTACCDWRLSVQIENAKTLHCESCGTPTVYSTSMQRHTQAFPPLSDAEALTIWATNIEEPLLASLIAQLVEEAVARVEFATQQAWGANDYSSDLAEAQAVLDSCDFTDLVLFVD